jgi:flagellum-specific peptidoglycan hydrolase FlgJ
MDAARAGSLAASADPNALNALRNRGGDPAVARAVAGQFGSFLMQGMMQDADGNAMSMAGGTGGAAVSSMFASAMSHYAMSGDQMGLADRIYRSMVAKGGPQPDAAKADSSPPAAGTAARAATNAQPTAQGGGIALGPYWHLGGHRPFGSPVGHFVPPGEHAAPHRAGDKAVAGHRVVDTPTKIRSSATQHADAPSVAANALTSAGTKAPQAPASIPWPHVHLLGRDLIAQAPAENDASRASPDPKTQAVAQSAGPAGPHQDEPFPWNVLHRIGHALRGSASVPADAGVHSPAMPATAIGPAPAGMARVDDAPIRSDDSVTPIGKESIGPPRPHHADNGNRSLIQAEEFAGELAPALNQAATRLGVSPRVLLAQAALETGWGHSVVGNNIFGIKAGGSWNGTSVTANTHEMESGHFVARRDSFRSYATVADAVDDYVTLVTASRRYHAAIGSGDNAEAYGHVLAAGGYATDRNYAAKLAAVADSPAMSYATGATDQAAADQRLLAHG